MKLYAHQQKIIDEDPKKSGLFLGTGSGKTRIALLLARGKTLVIAPKTQVEDGNWERELMAIIGPISVNPHISNMHVISKETFRRDHAELPAFDTVIVDEAHTCLGVQPNVRWRNKKPVPKASQLYEALEAYLERTKPDRLYLATATILRSPMAVWAAARLLGRDWNFYEFREQYYVRIPMPDRREVWLAKTDENTKVRLASTIHKLGYVGRLEDFFDVPEQTFKTFHIELTKGQKDRIKDLKIEYPDPFVRVGKVHQVENGVLAGNEFSEAEYFDNNKVDAILDLAEEFPRMVVFAKYTRQIQQIYNGLVKAKKTVLVLTGETEDRGSVIEKANSLPECIFIAQASMSAGWQLPHYPVMVFASRTYEWVHYDQALGRIQRADNIKKNLYINLVVKGGTDEAVDKALENKQDFSEKLYAKNV